MQIDISLDSETKSQLQQIVSNAKCVIRLYPVTQDNLASQNVADDKEALQKAAIEFLRKELNIKDYEVKDDDVVETFRPTNTSTFKMSKVYVKFRSEGPVNLCLKLANFLRQPEIKISRYFPRHLLRELRH